MNEQQGLAGVSSTSLFDASNLRQRAEACTPPQNSPLPEDIHRLVHELYVHQTELQMQNEELRRLQSELELGKARYFELYDMAPVGYLTVNESGLILEANLTAATLLLHARGTLKMRPISKFIFSEDQDIYYQNRKQLCQSEIQQSCYLRLVRKDEAIIWVHLSANVMHQDGETWHRVALSDISQQKQAELLLQANQEQQRQLIDVLPVGVILQGPHSEVISANSKAVTLLGLTQDQIMGKTSFDPDWNVIHEDGSPFPVSNYPVPQAIATRQSVHGVVMGVYRTAFQDRIWLLVNAQLLLNPDGSIHLVVCTVDDITKAKQTEESRARQSILIDELSGRLIKGHEQERRRFSRELHDRTSPNLAALRINLKIMAQASPEERASQQLLDRIEDTQALVEDTTFSVRDICSEFRSPANDGGGLLGMVETYAEQFFKRTGLTVTVQCPHCEIRLTPEKELALFRFVQEALTNCLKHAQATSILVLLQLDTSPLLLSIQDDGIGLDYSAASVPVYEQGQGLNNMKESANLIGGRFTLKSVPGRGTRVSIEI